jgi:hypothetical protein
LFVDQLTICTLFCASNFSCGIIYTTVDKIRLVQTRWIEFLASPCFDYSGNFGRVICVFKLRNWPRNVHLRASRMRLCSVTLEILYARFKNSKWAIRNIHLRVTGLI